MTKGNSQQIALLEEQRLGSQSAVCWLALLYISCSQIPTLLSTLPVIFLSPPFIIPLSFLLILVHSLLPFSLTKQSSTEHSWGVFLAELQAA